MLFCGEGTCRNKPTLTSDPESALPATLLASALFVISTNRHGLQWRLDQPESDAQVMQPVLDFLFHGAPFRVVPSGQNSEARSH